VKDAAACLPAFFDACKGKKKTAEWRFSEFAFFRLVVARTKPEKQGLRLGVQQTALFANALLRLQRGEENRFLRFSEIGFFLTRPFTRGVKDAAACLPAFFDACKGKKKTAEWRFSGIARLNNKNQKGDKVCFLQEYSVCCFLR
jgi:hypothetical protein